MCEPINLSDIVAKPDRRGVLVYTLPPNTCLYRGSDNPLTENSLRKYDIKFFAVNREDAKEYAKKTKNINEYSTKRALNLVALDQPNDAFYEMAGNDRVDILDRRMKKTGEKKSIQEILHNQYGFKKDFQKRFSVNKYDSAIVRYICAHGYDGYALINKMPTDFGGKFHPEVAVCAPISVTYHSDNFVSPIAEDVHETTDDANSPSSRSRRRRSPAATAVKSNLFGNDEDEDDESREVKTNLFGNDEDDEYASPLRNRKVGSPSPMKTRKIKTPSPPTKKTRRVLFDSPSSPEKGGKRRTNKKRHNK